MWTCAQQKFDLGRLHMVGMIHGYIRMNFENKHVIYHPPTLKILLVPQQTTELFSFLFFFFFFFLDFLFLPFFFILLSAAPIGSQPKFTNICWYLIRLASTFIQELNIARNIGCGQGMILNKMFWVYGSVLCGIEFLHE